MPAGCLVLVMYTCGGTLCIDSELVVAARLCVPARDRRRRAWVEVEELLSISVSPRTTMNRNSFLRRVYVLLYYDLLRDDMMMRVRM